eukprot:847335_1
MKLWLPMNRIIDPLMTLPSLSMAVTGEEMSLSNFKCEVLDFVCASICMISIGNDEQNKVQCLFQSQTKKEMSKKDRCLNIGRGEGSVIIKTRSDNLVIIGDNHSAAHPQTSYKLSLG